MPHTFEEVSNGSTGRRRTRIDGEEDISTAGPSATRGMEAKVLRLQHQAGNRAVTVMLQRRVSQARGAACAFDGDEASAAESGGAPCFVAMPPEMQEGGDGPTVDAEAGRATVSSATASPSVTGGGIASPTVVSWASANALEGEGARAIPGPSTATLAAIQAAAGGGTGTVGWTSFPLGTAKAPQFNFGSVSSAPAGMGPPSWSCTPTWKQHFYEGDSVCMYLGAARHPTTLTEGGKPVFWNVSAAISTRDGQAEAEHSNDIKRARDISIKEAETVLNDHVIGQTFPAAGTQAQAEQKVLDRITSKLTHAGLGNDQTKWAGIYETLYRKTLTRDNNGWHTFALGGRAENAAGEVDYSLNNGTTSINTTTSNALIIY